jgi:SAM-dependent methyltransferase
MFRMRHRGMIGGMWYKVRRLNAREREGARGVRRVDVHLSSVAQLREYAAVADRIAADRPGVVLDWGCGFGQMIALLDKRGVRATGCDYHPDAGGLRTERLERFPRFQRLVTDDPVRLPYDDESFDAALSLGVLEHVEQPEASLDELRRVVRPGGRLYVYKLPYRRSWVECVARHTPARFGLYYHGMYTTDRLYDPATACALIERHGFAVHSVRRANVLPLMLPLPYGLAGAWWQTNRALTRLRPLRAFATNVELIASRP